jgi:hypothetical protein
MLSRYEVLDASSYVQNLRAVKVLTVRADIPATLSVHVKKVLIRISAGSSAIVTELVHGFPRFLQANARTVPQ